MPKAVEPPTPVIEHMPVSPGGECPGCHWPNGPAGTPGFSAEPHAMANIQRNVPITNTCANCGAFWNLDTVECSTCGWRPKTDALVDKLITEKNAILRRMGGILLAPREMPIEVGTSRSKAEAQAEWDRLHGPGSADPRDPATGQPLA